MSLRRYFQRASWDRERGEEIEEYIEIETAANVSRGMDLQPARQAADRKLGNTARIRDEIYEMNTITLLDSLLRDARYALRGLGRNRLFTATALLTLGIGI